MVSKTNPPKAAMTRKEALAVVHQALDALRWHLHVPEATEEERTLRRQISPALLVLDAAIHGNPPFNSTSSLCEVCYLRYPSLDNPFVTLKDGKNITSVCTPCLEHLQAEGTIATLEDWRTGEVTQC